MIIVCKNCKASYLVAAISFGTGPRTVRCARCKHVWTEVPAGKVAQTQPPQKRAVPTPHTETSHPKPVPTSAQTVTTAPTPKPKRISFSQAKKLFWASSGIAAGLLILLITGFIAGHNFIIKNWPETQHIYIMLNLAKDPLKDNLVLANITSERRYQDGAMQLVVQGNIQSHARKRQVIPALSVEALGPDGRIIESWRIDPPKGTIDPGTTVPFLSSIISPEGTVVEVNLSFVEAPHDEH